VDALGEGRGDSDTSGLDMWAALGAALRAALLELHYVFDLRVCEWSVW
jgi:hypothetical protein